MSSMHAAFACAKPQRVGRSLGITPAHDASLDTLPFARIGGVADERRTIFALDLRSPERPIVRTRYENEGPITAAQVARDADAWLSDPSLHGPAPLRRTKPPRELTLPPELLGADEEARLDAVAASVSERKVRLAPPLSEAAIDAFERAHGVRLPPAYRAFVRRVGNGGEGPPQAGLRPLEETAPLDEKFTFTKAQLWEGHADAAAKIARARRGNLRLGDDGCGMEWILVVTGPARGQVWRFTDVGVQPAEPQTDFIEWYERWLRGDDEE